MDEAVLAGLPEPAFAQLRSEGFLAGVYAHLISLQAVSDFLISSAAARADATDSPRGTGPVQTASIDILEDDAA